MDRDDILKKSREENRNGDERELQIRRQAALPVIITMGIIGLILMCLEWIFLDTTLLTDGLYLLFTFVAAVQQWYLLAVLKKKYLIFTGIAFTFVSILAIMNLIDTFISMV